MKPSTTIFSDFLTALGIPHTGRYSDARFRAMPFQSLFGLTHLLKDYGIESEGWNLVDKSELAKLTPPFLAQKNDGVFVVVNTPVSNDGGDVSINDNGRERSLTVPELVGELNGIVLLAFPDENSAEPGYKAHSLSETIENLSGYALAVAALGLFVYFFATRGLGNSVWTSLAVGLNIFGLWLSFMLMQKSLGIHTSTSERVCGILERGGCDVITTSAASKLFGVFSWSEVGFGYFGVSLAVLLVFPHLWPALALCNILCLPYTVWSISYQKFVAHHWCTLCVGVQATLWALFGCYLAAGFTAHILPLHFDLIVLAGVYVAAVLSLHSLVMLFKNLPCHEKDSQT